MAPLDLGHWLADASAEQPCGPNLEFDADFGALERAAQGKPEQQAGDTLIPAEEPDWKDVAAQAQALLERTRDLRVVAHLGAARLHTHGIAGFAEALALMHQLVAGKWDSVHPQLDPEDDNDPTLRANAIMGIAEPARVQRKLRDTRLAGSKLIPGISWRDIAVQAGVAGILPIPGAPPLTELQIRSTFREADPAAVAATRAAVAQAHADARGILGVLMREAGDCKVTDLEDLEKLLRSMLAEIDRFAVREAEPAEAAAEAEPESAAAGVGDAPAVRRAAGAVTAASLTAITTRADAVRLLDLVMQYYERYEPSSPLPLLIDRARRLADKTFIDILRDIAPDGLTQARTIAGPQE